MVPRASTKGLFACRFRFFSPMSARLGALSAALALAIPLGTAGCVREKLDPLADHRPEERLAQEILRGVGGKDNYDAAEVIRFEIIEKEDGLEVSRRQHDYDKARGLYSIKWAPPNEETVTVNFDEKKGVSSATAILSSGVALRQDTDPERFSYVVEQAWQYYLRDRYMLFAPYRLMLDKSQMVYYGLEQSPLNRESQKLRVFPDPRFADQKDYTFYVHPDKKEIEAWVVRGDLGEEVYHWQTWQTKGPLRLAMVRKELKEGRRVYQVAKISVDVTFRGSEKR
jgi:hypothetical protein